MPSSGWKNAGIDSSVPWSTGDTRYQSSLNIAIAEPVQQPVRRPRRRGHDLARVEAPAARARWRGGSSSRRAWSPRESTDRPSDAPRARQSIHATE